MTDSTATKGTTIIERRNIGHASDNTELVFVKREHEYTPFVIWKRYKGAQRGDDAWTYSGHYCENFLRAVEQWAELSGQDYVHDISNGITLCGTYKRTTASE
jgi:hypothetical protein